MALEIAVKITGTEKHRDDKQAALHIIGIENDRRTAEAYEAKQADPDAPDAVLLPTEPNVEMYNSYETILGELLQKAHASYIDQAVTNDIRLKDIKEHFKGATDAQRQAALDALTT